MLLKTACETTAISNTLMAYSNKIKLQRIKDAFFPRKINKEGHNEKGLFDENRNVIKMDETISGKQPTK